MGRIKSKKDKRMKILFVVNQLGFIDPAGVACLSGVARDLGHERFLCVLDQQDISERIKEVKPDVIAYSFNSGEAQDIYRIHNEKVKHLRIFSIGGGAHPTFYSDTIKDSGMDAFCIGEGEAVFKEVLQSLDTGQWMGDVKGIRFRALTTSNELHDLCDLNTLPMPDRDLVLGSTWLGRAPRKTFFASRGCPFQCTYCLNPAFQKMWKGHGKWFRRFSVDRVLAEIKDVQSKYPLEFVKFDDDLFALKADDWLREFAERYPKEVGLPFNCLLRVDHVSDELLSLLKGAGCNSVMMAIDSANPRIRNNILNRHMAKSNEDLSRALRLVHRHGINSYANYITSLPTSTVEDELATIDISHKGKMSYANYSALVPFKGTAIWQYCKDHNLYDSEEIPKSLMKPSPLKGFTKKERRVARNVLLLGAIAAWLPWPLSSATKWMIKNIPPNKGFVVAYSLFRTWRMGTKMYPSKHNRLKSNYRAFWCNMRDAG